MANAVNLGECTFAKEALDLIGIPDDLSFLKQAHGQALGKSSDSFADTPVPAWEPILAAKNDKHKKNLPVHKDSCMLLALLPYPGAGSMSFFRRLLSPWLGGGHDAPSANRAKPET